MKESPKKDVRISDNDLRVIIIKKKTTNNDDLD